MDIVRRSIRQWIGASLLALAIVAPCGALADTERPAGAAGESVIVLFQDGTSEALRNKILRSAGGRPDRHFKRVTASVAHVPDPRVSAFLSQHPDVVAVVPDRTVEVLGRKTGGGSTTTAQVVPAGVKRVGAAPGSLAYTGLGVGIAVVDTGIDFNHRDLRPGGVCYTAYVTCQDENGHGTHVTGTTAALDNGIDVVGVAPNATAYAVRVLDGTGSGTDSTVMAGLEWVALNAHVVTPPIRVVNMSLGRPGTLGDNPALHKAVQDLYGLGIVVVVAAGNDARLEVSQQVPATYPEVLAVASTSASAGTNSCRNYPGVVAADSASYFTTDGAWVPDASGAGGIGVTVSAPGEQQENITKGCFLSSVGILSTRLGGGTVQMSGTSMATPHVTGVVALMMEQASGALAPDEARRRLRAGAARIAAAPLDSPATGYSFDGEREGVLSALGALLVP